MIRKVDLIEDNSSGLVYTTGGRVLEIAMTKAGFNTLAEERKANRGGSGFDEMGTHNSSKQNVNEGILCSTETPYTNSFFMGWDFASGKVGVSKTSYPLSNVNGVLHKLRGVNTATQTYEQTKVTLPTAPNIYPYDTVLTTEQINSGVIKHADSSNSGLIVNGKFNTDTSGWTQTTGVWSSTSNGATTTLSASEARLDQTILNLVAGKKYIVEFDYTSRIGSQDAVSIRDATTSIASRTLTALGRYTLEFTATLTAHTVRIYANGTGTFSIDNIAVYPADAISRSDLSMAESFHEDIAEKGFGYPLGNVQYLGGNTDGLTGITNGSFTGYETYSLFGNYQTPSSLIGKGYVWSSLTESQKKAFIANPENNCYLDGDKTIQVRYRVRVIQGLGDSWKIDGINNINPDSVNGWAETGFGGANFYIAPKGKKIYQNEFSSTFPAYRKGITDLATLGYAGIGHCYAMQSVSANDISAAYEGKCFALPIAIVHRRNQGMYHPVYNPNGTKKASDGNFWYNTAISFTSISDCFDQSKLLVASGYIGSVSGRPDGLFYDQVHEGDITDLRNSSKKVEDYNRLIGKEFNKLVAGSTRGKEGESDIVMIRTFTKTSTFGTDNNRFYFGISSTIYPQQSFSPTESNSYYLFGSNGSVYSANQVINQSATGTLYAPFGTTQVYIPIDGKNTTTSMNTLFPDGTTITVIVVKRTTRTKSNTLLHCDIIGNPTNYPTSWKQLGVFGTPLLVAEDGTSLLPTGTTGSDGLNSWKFGKKLNAQPLLVLKSSDNGSSWSALVSGTHYLVNLVNNNIGFYAPYMIKSTDLVMVYYQTHTSMAVPVVNSEVLEIGDVWAGNSQYTTSGNTLVNSLIGKTSVGTTAPVAVFNGKSIGYKFYNSPIEKFDIVTEYKPNHTAIASLGTTASPACKVLPYLTRTNGKAYLNLVFKEMKHNGTSWGDDSKFNIVDNVSTTTDNNAQTVLIGQKTVELPYFIAGDE